MEQNLAVINRRWGLWSIMLLILFVLLSGVTAAYFFYRRHLEEKALNGLSATERESFQTWLETPIKAKDDTLKLLPALKTDLVSQKKQFFDDVHQTRNTFANQMRSSHPETGLSVQEKLAKGLPLTADEAELVTSFTQQIKPLIESGKRLASRSDYTLETRAFPQNETSFLAYSSCCEVFYYYACATANFGQWDEAIDALDLLGKLLRVEEAGSYRENETHQWVTVFTSPLAKRTSDTAVLEQLLKVGATARTYVEYAANEPAFDATTVNSVRHMLADSYVTFKPVTRNDFYELTLTSRDYYQWVTATQATVDPDKAAAAKLIVSDSDNFFPDPPHVMRIRKFSAVLPKVIRRPLLYSAYYPQLINKYRFYESWKSGSREDLARYDIFCLNLSNRIAQIKGEDQSDANTKHLERYVSAVPTDPFSNGPFQYNKTIKQYYSVGPDGTGESADDIYSE